MWGFNQLGPGSVFQGDLGFGKSVSFSLPRTFQVGGGYHDDNYEVHLGEDDNILASDKKVVVNGVEYDYDRCRITIGSDVLPFPPKPRYEGQLQAGGHGTTYNYVKRMIYFTCHRMGKKVVLKVPFPPTP